MSERARPPAEGERRVAVMTGRVWCFADGLRAADILPVAEPGAPARGVTAVLFAGVDADLAGRLLPGDVLVAGQGLGAGPGGEAAARALAAAGFLCAIAGSFADGFDEALLAAGLPALEVDAPAVFHTGDRVRVNVEGGTVANLSSGDRQPLRNVTDAMLERLRAAVGR